MVDNQHKKISGYRDIPQSDIDLMNHIKTFEAMTNGLIDFLRRNPQYDQRFVSKGATDLENGYMWLVKSVAQPERKSVMFDPDNL